jgi:hypothetical protein
MTMIVDRLPCPRSTLRGQDNRAVSTGEAHVDTKRCRATFFPSKREDVDTVLKKAAILEMEDGATFRVLRIEHTEIPQVGYAEPHYEIEVEVLDADVQ